MKCASFGSILIDKVTIKKCHVEKIDISNSLVDICGNRQQKNRRSTILVNVENLYARPILTLDSTKNKYTLLAGHLFVGKIGPLKTNTFMKNNTM